MSLINEALKKAQRQRTDAPSLIVPAGEPSAPSIVKRRTPIPARTLMLLLVGGGLVLVTAGIITVVLLNLDSTPIVAVKSNIRLGPKPVPPTTINPDIPTVALPAIPAVEIATPPPIPEPVVVVKPTPPPAPVVLVSTPPPPPKPVANPAILTFIEAMRITGVRVSGRDSKVIMNDRIVRLNDYVDRTLGLRLTKIIDTTPDHSPSLVFTDANGYEYTKPL